MTEVLRTIDGSAVVVPAFLAAGYHVRIDIPAQVEESGHPAAVVTEPLGPSLVTVAYERLVEAGWSGEPIAFAAAGSSDQRALADIHRAARMLRTLAGVDVEVGYVATARPRITDLVRGRRFAIASWLLAPGAFHRALRATAPGIVAEPIGAHTRVVDLIVRRYRGALLPVTLGTCHAGTDRLRHSTQSAYSGCDSLSPVSTSSLPPGGPARSVTP